MTELSYKEELLRIESIAGGLAKIPPGYAREIELLNELFAIARDLEGSEDVAVIRIKASEEKEKNDKNIEDFKTQIEYFKTRSAEEIITMINKNLSLCSDDGYGEAREIVDKYIYTFLDNFPPYDFWDADKIISQDKAGIDHKQIALLAANVLGSSSEWRRQMDMAKSSSSFYPLANLNKYGFLNIVKYVIDKHNEP